MSEYDGPESSGDDSWAAPPPPPPPAPTEPPLTLDSEHEVTTSSGIGGRVLAGIIGVLLLVGGSVFAVTQLGSSGPSSAEDAVQELLDAAANEDVLGLLAALDPAERDVLADPVEDLFTELERLEVVDSSLELDGVAGVDFEFTDVTYRTEPVTDDLARVYFTGGTATSSIDLSEVPIGDFVRDTVERFDGDLSFSDSQSESMEDEDFFIVAREGGDGWRVSIAYTIAEHARDDAGQPLPTSTVVPVGANSPEAAVQGMIDAVAALDVRDMIARLSPDEFGALQDYAQLFLPEVENEIDQSRDEFELSIHDVELRSETSGDRASVFVDAFGFTVSADGMTFTVDYADGCVEFSGDLDEAGFGLFLPEGFGDGPMCTEDFEQMSEFRGGFGIFGMDTEAFEDLPKIEPEPIGITTKRVDGMWYVAPIATGTDAGLAFLRAIERSHLDAFVEAIESFFSGFEESFSEIGTTIEPGTEEFGEEITEGIGEIVTPTTSSLETGGRVLSDQEVDAALAEFMSVASESPEMADCMLAELANADPEIRRQLAESWINDTEPGPLAQDAFFAAFEACY